MLKFIAGSFHRHPVKMAVGTAVDIGGLALLVAYLVGAL